MSNPIHRRSVDRFMAMVDGREEVSVLASEYDALESENEALHSQLTDALNRQTCEGEQPYVCHALATARSRLAEADANAPWLTQAHMICTDHGIPQGNISDRLEMLVGYLAEAERDAERWKHCVAHGFPVRNQTLTSGRPWIAFVVYGSTHIAHFGNDGPAEAVDAAIDAAREGE